VRRADRVVRLERGRVVDTAVMEVA
jgi:hypothetical protein